MTRSFSDATCPACLTYYDRLPVERDASGDACVALPVRPCADCGALLCACCEQFACDGCGLTFCTAHLVRVPADPAELFEGETPLKCCAVCACETEACELPAPFPPQSETRPLRHAAEVA